MSNRAITGKIALHPSALDTLAKGDGAIDAKLGKPPTGITKAARTQWYSTANRYPSIKASSREFLERYIRVWMDANELERVLKKIYADDPVTRLTGRSYKALASMRKDMSLALTQLAVDIKRRS